MIIWTHTTLSMKIYSKIGIKHIASALALFVFVGMTCCTDVDNTLGTDLLPGDAGMETGFVSFKGSDVGNTFVTYRDTMNTMNQAFFLLGKMKSDTFGVSKFAHLGQFMPYDREEDAEYYGFGTGTVVDSMFIHLKMTFMSGDKNTEQTFYIYELNQPIDTTKNYKNDIAYEELLGDKLFEFNFSGQPSFTTADSVKLQPTTSGRAYMNKLIADTTLYYDFAKFHEAFDGVAIVSADASPDDAAVYYVASSSSYFKLWMHNYEPSDSSQVRDTLFWAYHFSGTQTYESPNASVASVRHNYSGTPIEPLIADTTQVSGVMYVHAPIGVTGKLEISEDLYSKLRALVTDEYSGIFINQALLHIYMENDDIEFINAAPARLGSYSNYADFTGIFDYDYYQEQYNGVSLSYDGYLTRTWGYYNLNITSYLQQAMINDEYKLPITFGPDYYSTLVSVARVSLDGVGGSNPIELSIIYTLVK